jgi:cysteinyl-tRNA synthetase
MSKSLGNFITLDDMFSGDHELLDQAYSPEVVRFFMLQAHYRNPLDFSNKALKAAEKGLERLLKGIQTLENLPVSDQAGFQVDELVNNCYDALNDDLNTPILIAHLFDGIKKINSIHDNKDRIDQKNLQKLKELYHIMVFEILGIKASKDANVEIDKMGDVMEILLNIRLEAKQNKDFETSDRIRDMLKEIGITVKDKKDGFDWEIE